MAASLFNLAASDALTMLRSGSLSVEDYASACLARIAARDHEVHAWAFLDPDLVIAEARLLDQRTVRGPLHGLPVGIKDIILTRDMPTRYNSSIYRDALPAHDAACVALLRGAGALILGKTETVEFAATGSPPPTANPHDLRRTPGGSSSGSATCVADGHVPLALGTQTGGSMIRPASFCGVFAMKPTWGLVSRDGVKAFAPTLDTIGWFARTAQDLALLYNVFDPEPADIAAFQVAGARIAVCRSPFWDQAEPATQAAFMEGARRLRDAGAYVVDLELPDAFAALGKVQGQIMRAEGRSSFLSEYRQAADRLHPSIRAIVENREGLSRQELRAAYDQAAEARAAFDLIAPGFDAVFTPSVPGEAPVGLAHTGAMTFNAMWTLLHVPCIHVPGFSGPSGMPVGLTLTCGRYDDRKLLGVAAAVAPIFAGA